MKLISRPRPSTTSNSTRFPRRTAPNLLARMETRMGCVFAGDVQMSKLKVVPPRRLDVSLRICALADNSLYDRIKIPLYLKFSRRGVFASTINANC